MRAQELLAVRGPVQREYRGIERDGFDRFGWRGGRSGTPDANLAFWVDGSRRKKVRFPGAPRKGLIKKSFTLSKTTERRDISP